MWKTMVFLALVLTAQVTFAAETPNLESLQNELEATRSELQALREQVETLKAAPTFRALSARSAAPMVLGAQPRPMLGIVMGDDPDGAGVRLTAVTPDAPAERAGLRAGDLIVAIDGQKLSGRRAASRAYDVLEKLEAGSTHEFEIERDGKRSRISVTAELVKPSLSFAFSGGDFDPPGQSFAFGWNADNNAMDLDRFRDWAEDSRNWSVIANSGRPFITGNLAPRVFGVGLNWANLELAALNPDLGRYFGADRGVLVIDSQLEDQTLKAGDVILMVDGVKVDQPRDTLRALRDFEPGEKVPFTVLRDGEELALQVETPKSPLSGYFYEFSTDNDQEDDD